MDISVLSENIVTLIELITISVSIIGGWWIFVKTKAEIDLRLIPKTVFKEGLSHGMHSTNIIYMIVKRIKGGEVRNPKYYFHFYNKKEGNYKYFPISVFNKIDIEGNIGRGRKIKLIIQSEYLLKSDMLVITFYYSHTYFPLRYKLIVYYRLENGILKNRRNMTCFSKFGSKENRKYELMGFDKWLNISN